MFENTLTLTQVAAIPFVEVCARVEILLITSRRRKRWIIPKGWPVDGLSYPDAAAKEASEEAGTFGEIGRETIGNYSYKKDTDGGYIVPCRVLVYPLRVTYQELTWREQGQRSLQWTPLDYACDAVEQKDLSDLLKSLAESCNSFFRLESPIPINHAKET